jgi:hypothetical protein
MTLDFISVNTMRRAQHSPYSSDLTLCNFYLFGYVQESLAGKEFLDRKDFLETVNRILEGSEKVTLEQIFLIGMERLARCVAINREYIDYIILLL